MNNNLPQRLRDLPPDLPEVPDRFDRVRARVRRNRSSRWTTTVASAVLVVGTTLGATWVLDHAGTSGRGQVDRGQSAERITDQSPATCPTVFIGSAPLAGSAGWVPQPPSGLDGNSRLVPDITPTSALLCAYPGSNTGPQTGWKLGGSVALAGPLAGLTDDLTLLPRTTNGTICSDKAGPQTTYLIAVTYPKGRLWVAAADDPNTCLGTTNGSFSSFVNIGRQLTAAYSAGAWVAVPDRPDVTPDERPCLPSRIGRLGQDADLVPGNPDRLLICTGEGTTRRSTTVTNGLAPLLHALNGQRHSLSTHGCLGPLASSPPAYQLIFHYPTGPSVMVSVLPGCVPPIDNGSLQADDVHAVTVLLPHAVTAAH